MFLRKYNTLTVTGTTAIRIPIIKRGVVDFAVSADWTPSAGDVKIAIDGAAAANVANLPTAVAMGNTAYWEFILTAAELTCKSCVVTVADSATKAVEDQSFIVETFGHASAMYQADLSAANLPANAVQFAGQTITAAAGVTIPASIASPTNITAGTITTVTTLTGHTPQTGDSFARIGALGAGLTSLAPAATALSTAVWTATIAGRIDVAVSSRLAPLVAGRDLSVAATTGAVALDSAATAALVDLIWDEAMSGHTTAGTYGGRIVRATNSNTEVQITGSNHIAADVHEFQTGVITAGDFAANSLTASALATDAVTEIQSGLATAAALATESTKINRIEAVATGTVTGAGTSTEVFVGPSATLTITVDSSGNRSAVVVT